MYTFIGLALFFAFTLVILFCHSFLASTSENEHGEASHPHVHTVLVSNRSLLESDGIIDAIPFVTDILLFFTLVYVVVALNAAWFRAIIDKFLSIRMFLRIQSALSEGIMHSKRFHFVS